MIVVGVVLILAPFVTKREAAVIHRIVMQLALAFLGLAERLAGLATKLDCYGY